MNGSQGGSGGSISEIRWTLPPQRDTTPEAQALQHRAWMALSGVERAEIWLGRIERCNELRMERLRRLHPGLDEAGVRRLWLDETYPGEFTAEYLDRVEVWMAWSVRSGKS